jgi:hypothetical protein
MYLKTAHFNTLCLPINTHFPHLHSSLFWNAIIKLMAQVTLWELFTWEADLLTSTWQRSNRFGADSRKATVLLSGRTSIYCIYEDVFKSFRTESITKYTLTTINTRWEATRRVMAAKLTRLTHKIRIQLHLVAESCIICSSRSRWPVRKLSVTPLY